VLVCGRVINASILARHMRMLELSDEKIQSLLEPGDAQNVPCAIELILTLRRISKMSTANLNVADVHDRGPIWMLAEVYEALLLPFILPQMTLSQQIEHLRKFAHLSYALQREAGTQFMPNELYFDSQALVKSIIITLFKDIALGDPKLKFYLILAGTDCLELLFSLAQTIVCYGFLLSYGHFLLQVLVKDSCGLLFISFLLCIRSLDLSRTFFIFHLFLPVSCSSVSPFFIIVTHLRSLAQQLRSNCAVFNFIIPSLILCFILCFKGCGDDLYTIYTHL
jgi:hypothetical protein